MSDVLQHIMTTLVNVEWQRTYSIGITIQYGPSLTRCSKSHHRGMELICQSPNVIFILMWLKTPFKISFNALAKDSLNHIFEHTPYLLKDRDSLLYTHMSPWPNWLYQWMHLLYPLRDTILLHHQEIIHSLIRQLWCLRSKD